MPTELKQGTWFGNEGNYININELWIKDKKGWKIPEIRLSEA